MNARALALSSAWRTPVPRSFPLAILLAILLASGLAGAQTPVAPTKAPDPVASTYRPLTGKLFFNDTERARLEKARKDGVQVIDTEVLARAPQLDGFIRSSDGRTTYWVDGVARGGSARTSSARSPASSMVGPELAVTLKESGAAAARAPSNKRASLPKRAPRAASADGAKQ
jgi:hypothetical protein